MSSEKVNPIKDQPYAISPAMTDAPPPPYSSLYPGPAAAAAAAAAAHHAAGYGAIQMTNHPIPLSHPFYPHPGHHPAHQNGVGAVAPPPPPPHPQMMATAAGPPPSTHHQMLGPSLASHHHHQMYAAAAAAAAAASMPQHYIPTASAATGQPYIYQTVVPTAYGPMLAPVQFTAAANSPAMMIAAAAASDCFDPRNAGGPAVAAAAAARFDEMARQNSFPMATSGPFGIIPQSQAMALMYGHNGPMLVSKPSKKPFY